MTACPDRLLMLHGLIDGELDAANSIAIETHIKGCAGCAEALRELEAVRAAIAAPGVRHQAPPNLHERIDAMLAQATDALRTAEPHRRSTPGWTIGGTALALAASLALLVASPQMLTRGDQEQFVSSHVHSLLAAHLVDIQTSNRHVVKPWFNGRIDFAPPVVDLIDRGYPLVGGRLDYVDDHVVAAIVYRRRLHVINLFVRPAGTLASPATDIFRREGYTLVRWREAGLEFWAVSDIEPAELDQFHQIFAARTR